MFTTSAPAHLVDWACRSQRHVARSTFAAELLSARDAIDQGILVSHMLLECESGPLSAHTARQKRDDQGYVPTALCIDAKSVFAAVTASMIKAPSDKSLLCHVQYLRELLDNRVLQSLVWLDTRDMTADGLTKGAVPRDLEPSRSLTQPKHGARRAKTMTRVCEGRDPQLWSHSHLDRVYEGIDPQLCSLSHLDRVCVGIVPQLW